MRIGIDVGGTKIEIIALADDGRELYRHRVATPASEGYAAILSAIVGMVREAEDRLGETATVGIGTPGAPSRVDGRLRNSNTTCLNGQAVEQDLSRALERPVRIANDANCFALSEATDGAGRGAPVVFGAILGTGTGGGVVVDGRLLTGPNAIAGEWGHNPLPWPRPDELPGPSCYCGRSGCIETFVSGPGLERDHGTGSAAHEIAASAESGDLQALATLERYGDRLARSLASLVNILDPDVIVLGGGVSRIDRLYTTLPPLTARHVFSDRLDTRIAAAQHGDSSGVRGAAWLFGANETASSRG